MEADKRRRNRRIAAMKRKQERQRRAAMQIHNRIARLRNAYQKKRRHIDSLPIDREERDHLLELAETGFRTESTT